MKFEISVLGAGAFGTSLAISQARSNRAIALWGRNREQMLQIQEARENSDRLPSIPFPDNLHPLVEMEEAASAPIILLAVPTQSLRGFLIRYRGHLQHKTLVLCCKGIERSTGMLPTQVVQDVVPNASCAVLTGPSFAADIGRGKPTALTLASDMPEEDLNQLQLCLSNTTLRIYSNDDPIGAQLGGALKNVVAIGAGICIGAGLGESARAALMTRGFSEITQLAAIRGGQTQTLYGLSGLGDLVLTCTSTKSRNFSYGIDLGSKTESARNAVVEGVMTAQAASESMPEIELPVTRAIAALISEQLSLEEAIRALMQRPLRQES